MLDDMSASANRCTYVIMLSCWSDQFHQRRLSVMYYVYTVVLVYREVENVWGGGAEFIERR